MLATHILLILGISPTRLRTPSRANWMWRASSVTWIRMSRCTIGCSSGSSIICRCSASKISSPISAATHRNAPRNASGSALMTMRW